MINYLTQPNIGNMSEMTASKYVAYYWGGAMVGRFIGSALLQKIKTGTLLGIFGLVAALLVTPIEAAPLHFDDNLIIPICGASATWAGVVLLH